MTDESRSAPESRETGNFWDRGKLIYRAGRSCPKCGYHIVASEHASFGYLGMPDYIRRTCQRCERVWDEIPLDRASRDALHTADSGGLQDSPSVAAVLPVQEKP